MKKVERRIIELYNQTTHSQFIEVQDQYNRFDAQQPGAIAEIKYRKKFYNRVMIEFDKYSYNKEYAKLFGLDFIYIVVMEKTFYGFNISSIDGSFHNYKWEWRKMPRYTEFNNSEETKKLVGYIYVDQAYTKFEV